MHENYYYNIMQRINDLDINNEDVRKLHDYISCLVQKLILIINSPIISFFIWCNIF